MKARSVLAEVASPKVTDPVNIPEFAGVSVSVNPMIPAGSLDDVKESKTRFPTPVLVESSTLITAVSSRLNSDLTCPDSKSANETQGQAKVEVLNKILSGAKFMRSLHVTNTVSPDAAICG